MEADRILFPFFLGCRGNRQKGSSEEKERVGTSSLLIGMTHGHYCADDYRAPKLGRASSTSLEPYFLGCRENRDKHRLLNHLRHFLFAFTSFATLSVSFFIHSIGSFRIFLAIVGLSLVVLITEEEIEKLEILMKFERLDFALHYLEPAKTCWSSLSLFQEETFFDLTTN